MRFKLFYFLIYFAFFSCKKEALTIDGTNRDTFQESVALMERELPSDQAPKLQEAITLISIFNTQQDTDELRASRTRHLLNKKTSNEIFTMAERVTKQKGIQWSRSSLGLLDLPEIQKNNVAKRVKESSDESLINAQSIALSTKLMDQNHDGISDAIMLFVAFKDSEGNIIDFENGDNNAEIEIVQDGRIVFRKSQNINSSEVGQTALNRGLILPFHVFQSENIKSNSVDISVLVVTPYRSLMGNKLGYDIPFKEYILGNRIDQLTLEKEKNEAKSVVENFLLNIGSGDLESAYSKSVNPDWRNFEKFKSKDLGYGKVDGVTIENVFVKDFNYEKEKANIEAIYTFKMKGEEEFSLHKVFSVQKIAGEWKIVSASKVNP